MKNLFRAAVTMGAIGVAAGPAMSDEGMWLLTSPPTAQLKARYGFEPSAEWLERMQKSCVRLSTGGSGSLVSPDGLVMTNHHVGSEMLAKLSSAGNDLEEKGFSATTRAAELRCPDLEINILWTIRDITAEVMAAGAGKSPAEAAAERRKAMSSIEKAAHDADGLLYQVVTLFNGGRYHLYGYKQYQDVRLVFAPEKQAAYFGGDIDNFEFPRFNLDMCFFRIYENEQPLKCEHFLRWSDGAKEGDLVFVFGQPGATRRLATPDHLRFIRDVSLPFNLRNQCQREIEMQAFCGRSAEHARIGEETLLGISNGRKANTGRMGGLLDPAFFERKRAEEARLRAAYEKMAGASAAEKDPWAMIASAQEVARSQFQKRAGINAALSGELAGTALTLVRLAAEKPKPNPERLREFRETAMPTLFHNLYSPAPIYDELEVASLASGLTRMAILLGPEDPLVVKVLAGQSPERRAGQLVLGSKLKDVAERRRLAEGGVEAIAASTDPMIELARLIDPESRAVRKVFEDQVEAVEREAYALIANAKFAADGDSTYPDATFTLRLSYGTVKGWEEGGRQVPAFTTFGGMYERAAERKGLPPFDLPRAWQARKDKIDLSTPFNLVATADIIGGNSGSPMVNKEGEVVGLIFDGNIHSLVGDYYYDERDNRAVAVDCRAMIEAIKNVYEAPGLASEILGQQN